MDTNAKGYKYSVFTKAVCILISLSLFSLFIGLSTSSVMSYYYWRDSETTEKWYRTKTFENEFESDISVILNSYLSSKKTDDLVKFLDSKKDDAVSVVYEQFLKYESENGPPVYDEYGDVQSTDRIFYYKPENKALGFLSEFSVSYNEIWQHRESDPKNVISDKYNEFASENQNYFSDADYNGWMLQNAEKKFNESLIYAAGIRNDYTNNLSSVSWGENTKEYKKHFSENEIYFMVVNGEAQYAGITDKLAKHIYKTYIESDPYAKNTELYVAISLPQDTRDVVGDIRFWNDKYINMAEFNDYSKVYEKHSGLFVGIEILLLAASVISGLTALSPAGKRSDSGQVRLLFVDKIPFELHFALSGAIAAAVAFLFISMFNVFIPAYSPMTPLWATAFSAVCWLVIFEFAYSVARFIKSKRDIKTGFLCFKIFSLLKKARHSVSAALSYKPQKFSKNVVMISIIYVLSNLTCAGIIAAFLAANANLFAVLLIFADLGINLYLFVKFLKYIRQLDEIILASVERRDLSLDFSQLPNSLRLLAESMKYTNDELQNAVAKAVKDEKLRTELITNVSHDLKTPLTSIITYVDLLSKRPIDDENAREYIGVLEDKSAKLKRLIDDLIEASKVTSGNITVNPSPISLSELCLQSTVDARQDFKNAGLSLVVKGGANPPTVIADGAKTFRIIENLLSNARKYSAVGSRVYVNVYTENKFGVFEIKNISAQQLDITPDELTERFVRGDKSRSNEGNGLGLSIAKELCKLQNGSLRLTIDGDLFKAKVMLPLAQDFKTGEINK